MSGVFRSLREFFAVPTSSCLSLPFVVGRESEYGVDVPGATAREFALRIIHEALFRFPSAAGDRHGGEVDGATVFTDNEVLYLDPSGAGIARWFTLEAAGYECDDPWMVQHRVMLSEARINALATEVERKAALRAGAIRIHALGDDFYRGRTRGYHFNYLLHTDLSDVQQQTLALWMVAGSALLGAGGLGGARGALCDGRIHHLDAVRGASINYGNRTRGLFNIGRGQLCGAGGRRLHMMNQGSTRLSMILSDGLTMLVVRAAELEALAWRDPLIEPILQMKELNRSADPLAFRLRTQGGREIPLTAILHWFARGLESFVASDASGLPGWAGERILRAFASLCGAASAGHRLFLAERLDAWMRWRLFDEVAFERHGLRLPGLARWMAVAALLGREGAFRRWDIAARARSPVPACLAEVSPWLEAPAQRLLDQIVHHDRLDVRDTGFPRYMEAVRDLADLEFSLGSAREDNPLPMLARCGYVRPFFGESFRVDPDSPPPKAANRARARSILIRRHSRARRRGSREKLRASWNHVALVEPGLEGNPAQTRIYDLSDPIQTVVPKARRVPVQLRLPEQLPRVALLLAESYGRIRERVEGQE